MRVNPYKRSFTESRKPGVEGMFLFIHPIVVEFGKFIGNEFLDTGREFEMHTFILTHTSLMRNMSRASNNSEGKSVSLLIR